MKVVFLEEVEGTAMAGDVKNVADGFARNYLLPRKLAAPATEHYIAIATQKATKYARKQEKVDAEAQDKILPLVDGKSVTIEVRVGEQDKLFGSVTTRDIAEALQAETKVEIDHKQVDLRQPLRETGAHQVPVKLTRNVIATVTVNVVRLGGDGEVIEEPEPEAVAEDAEAEASEAEEVTAEAAEAEAEAEETTEETAETAVEDAAAEAETADEEKPAEAAPDEEESTSTEG